MELDKYGVDIFEVLEYGPVVAWDKQSGLIVTVSASCFNSWAYIRNGYYIGGTECLIVDIPKVGDCTDLSLVREVAQDWLKELLATEGQDEPSNC